MKFTKCVPCLKAVSIFSLSVMFVLFGCGGDEETRGYDVSDKALLTLGAKKHQPTNQSVAAAPEIPTDSSRPHVTEVGYYRDWRLTKPLTGNVRPGDTIYTKVVFSEPMQFVPDDDKKSRPILYYRVGKKLTRYAVVARGRKISSGVAKPKGTGTDDYICKYVVPEDADTQKFTFAVGKLTANTQGRTLGTFYVHTEKVSIRSADKTLPTITQVNYYHDSQLTKPITENIKPGDTIYTKVVFSEPARHVVADDDTARPALSMVMNHTGIRYRIKAHGARGEDFQSGDCKPLKSGTDDYICKYTLTNAAHTVGLLLGENTTDIAGNAVAEALFYRAPFEVVSPVVRPDPEPIPEEPAIDLLPEAPTIDPHMATPQPETEEEAARKARLLMLWILSEQARFRGQVQSTRARFSSYETVKLWEELIGNRIGISRDLAIKLYLILLDESPHGIPEKLRINSRWVPESAYEYLRLRYLHPEKSEDELVELFRQSAHAEKIIITGLFGQTIYFAEIREAETLLLE